MRFSIICFFLLSGIAARAQDGAPTYQLEGKAALTTNLVEYGLTQSNKDPALLGSFWFNWGPQFRLGLEGNNVHYEGDDSHFRMRIGADLRVAFSPNSSMTIRFGAFNHFKPGTRDGTVTGLHLDLFGYGIIYDQLSNFMGTEDSATYVAFSKSWPAFQTWKWENQIGYMMLSSNGLTSYFDLKSMMGIKPSNITYQIGGTYHSSPAQFNGTAGPFLLATATVEF